MVFSQFNWVDGKIYISKNPSLWPHAVPGEYIKMSVSCESWSSQKRFSKTMVHEFGHMFGLLEDEYVYIYTQKNIGFDNKNCAYISAVPNILGDNIGKVELGAEIEEVIRWTGIEGYDGTLIRGCTNANSVRSSQNSIMREQYSISSESWSQSWFPVNEYYLNQELAKYKGEDKPIPPEGIPPDIPDINIPGGIGGIGGT